MLLKKMMKCYLHGINNKECIFKNLYFNFNSITKQTQQNIQNAITINTLNVINTTYFSYNKSNIFNKYIKCNELIFKTPTYKEMLDNYFTIPFIYNYQHYIIFNIIKYNLQNLIKYKNNNLDLIFKRFNIVSNEEDTDKSYMKHSVLLHLYKMLNHGNLHSTIYKNQVLVSIPVKYCFDTYRINTTFSILYFLNILTNITNEKNITKIIFKHNFHDCSHFILNRLTLDIIKYANLQAKLLIEKEITKSSHYIIQQNFNEEVANKVYTRQKSKFNTARALKTTEDIHNIINNKMLQINKYGYLTVEEIFEELYYLNIDRQAKSQEFNKISKSCDKFIRSTLTNIPETKQLLKDLDLVYKTLNNATIENILKHQEKNNTIKKYKLDCYKKVILLKKLYKGGRQNGKSLHNKRSSRKTTQNRKNN